MKNSDKNTNMLDLLKYQSTCTNTNKFITLDTGSHLTISGKINMLNKRAG